MKLGRQQVSFKNITDVKFNVIFLYAMIIASVICPGLLSIYVYNNGLFVSLDVVKLVLLAISIGSPLFGWSLFLSMLLILFDCDISRLYFSENQVYDILLLASFQTFIILNLAIALGWLLEWNYQTYFTSIFGASMLMACLVLATIIRSKFSRKSPKYLKEPKDEKRP